MYLRRYAKLTSRVEAFERKALEKGEARYIVHTFATGVARMDTMPRIARILLIQVVSNVDSKDIKPLTVRTNQLA